MIEAKKIDEIKVFVEKHWIFWQLKKATNLTKTKKRICFCSPKKVILSIILMQKLSKNSSRKTADDQSLRELYFGVCFFSSFGWPVSDTSNLQAWINSGSKKLAISQVQQNPHLNWNKSIYKTFFVLQNGFMIIFVDFFSSVSWYCCSLTCSHLFFWCYCCLAAFVFNSLFALCSPNNAWNADLLGSFGNVRKPQPKNK